MKTEFRAGSVLRIVLLCAVLLVVIAGAGWEFGVTLPGFKNALDNLDTIAKSNMTEPRTRADVVEQISSKPVETSYKQFELGSGDQAVVRHQRVDRYRWSRIMPGKDKLEFLVSYECIVSGDELEGFDVKSCPDAKWNFKNHYQPGNAPASVTIGERQKVSVEQSLFETMDEDVDGFLSKRELAPNSLIIKEMELFDPDGDQKVSFKEFEAATKKIEDEKGRKLNRQELYSFFGGMSPGEGNSLPGGGAKTKGGGKKSGKKNGGEKKAAETGGEGGSTGGKSDGDSKPAEKTDDQK